MIQCHKCNSQNSSKAQRCSQCNANLLPGERIGERLGAIFICIIFAALCLALTYFVLKPDMGIRFTMITLGVLAIVSGACWAARKTPLYEKYQMRAKRHETIDPQQAIADYAAAINCAPEQYVFGLLCKRADLCQVQGMLSEAQADWQSALHDVNHRITASHGVNLELLKQRAEIYEHLGMEEAYAMEMLGYTIEKERVLKFEKGGSAKNMDDGNKKSAEIKERDQLEHLRSLVMEKGKYIIVGYCAQCGTMVELNPKLECMKNPKHYGITNIKPTVKEDDLF